MSESKAYRIGENLTVRPEADELEFSGKSGFNGTVKLEPRLMKVLNLLASHAGSVVPREQFLLEVWENYEGADEALTQAVSKLRKTVVESGVTYQIIETIPKKGYKLNPTVLPVSQEANTDLRHMEEQNTQQHRHLTFALLVLVISLVGWLIFSVLNEESAPAPEAPNTSQEQLDNG